MNNRPSVLTRLRSAWNIFRDKSPEDSLQPIGASYVIPQHRKRLTMGNERSIVNSIYSRASIDVAALKFLHVRVDENDTYIDTINSGLNSCLTLEANIDQTSRAFIQDVVVSLFDEGSVAIVPVDTSVSLMTQNSFDILSMRTAKIVQWYPHHVRVLVYNDNRGEKEEVTIPKDKTCIIENPLYSVMNERNSTLQRLITKLNLLDSVDEQSGSGKLDLMIQLPYVVKSEARQAQADKRRRDIEEQLRDSKYGIAYIDGTERITQLNRPAENNLMGQIEYLTRMLYSQLGISENILNGTADEKELLNYYNRTLEPVASAISDEMKRKFLTKTAQTQGQSVKHYRNLFSIVTPERLGDLADKLTRNEIATSNEMRSVIGWKPSKAPGADELRNKNLNPTTTEPETKTESESPVDVTDLLLTDAMKEKIQNGRL